MPDVYFSLGNGVTGWIELKVVPDERRSRSLRAPVTGSLRPLQVLWAQQASAQNISQMCCFTIGNERYLLQVEM